MIDTEIRDEAAARGGPDKIVVMNPTGYPPSIKQLGMAPRLDSLDGKTVYLVDCRFDDGDILLRQMEGWFEEYMPGVRTVFAQKAGVYTEDDPHLFQEIRERADAVILGVGH